MGVFRTTDGAEWSVSVNVGTIKRVRELTGVNLPSLISDTAAVADVFSDHVRLAEVLAAVVRPQLDAAKKSPDDFFAALDGTVVEAATEALLREVANFFQEPTRSLLLKAMDKVQEASRQRVEAGAAEALKALEVVDGLILTSSALSSPASAA
jgi:hypothetical protein